MEQLSLNPRLLKLLSVFVLNPDQQFYVRELAKKNRLPASTTSRLLDKLLDQQILQFNTKGSLKLFQLNTRHPYLLEIKNLVTKEHGLEPRLFATVRSLPGINFASIYGSAASGRLDSHSDIDLLLVGSPPVDQLNQSLNKLEKTLGREINYTLYSLNEFRQKKKQPGFLNTVLKGKHSVIINQLPHE